MDRTPKRISRLRKWIGAIVAIVLLTTAFAFAQGSLRTFRIVSASMTPTISVGDCVLVDARKSHAVRRGDIVAIVHPESPINWLCKRLVAVPGDRIEFRDGYLYVNDKRQSDERYSMHTTSLIASNAHEYSADLSHDEYYVIGDNEEESNDSRDFGPVHLRDFIGVATHIYWPLDRARSLRGRARAAASD